MAEPQRSDAFDSGRHDRPDWLTGAEPDEAELADAGRSTDITRMPGLIGAADSAAQQPSTSEVRPVPPAPIPLPPRDAVRPPAPPAAAPTPEAAAPGPMQPWRAASSSVPKLPAVKPAAESAPRPPGPGDAAPPPPPAAAEEPSPNALDRDGAGRQAPPPQLGSAMPTVLPPLPEPWWMVLIDTIRTQRRAQIITLVVLALVLVTVILLPQVPRGTPLSTIHRTPTAWDGRTVTVSGRVDQAFPLAGGWAFYLVQGRDTMVTFTRVRMPVVGERVVVTGQINTGFLDGIPRQALFEQAAAAK